LPELAILVPLVAPYCVVRRADDPARIRCGNSAGARDWSRTRRYWVRNPPAIIRPSHWRPATLATSCLGARRNVPS